MLVAPGAGDAGEAAESSTSTTSSAAPRATGAPLDSAFVVRYDAPVEGSAAWRQRNLTIVGGGESLCVIGYAPLPAWKKSKHPASSCWRRCSRAWRFSLGAERVRGPAGARRLAPADLVGRRRQGRHRQVAADRVRSAGSSPAWAGAWCSSTRTSAERTCTPASGCRPPAARSATSSSGGSRRSRTWSSRPGRRGSRLISGAPDLLSAANIKHVQKLRVMQPHPLAGRGRGADRPRRRARPSTASTSSCSRTCRSWPWCRSRPRSRTATVSSRARSTASCAARREERAAARAGRHGARPAERRGHPHAARPARARRGRATREPPTSCAAAVAGFQPRFVVNEVRDVSDVAHRPPARGRLRAPPRPARELRRASCTTTTRCGRRCAGAGCSWPTRRPRARPSRSGS